MQPLSPSATTEVLDLLTPDMQALVVEANIKNNNAGPIATAWEAALLKAIRIPSNDSDTLPFEKKEGGVVVVGKEDEKNERPSLVERSSSSSSIRSRNFWEKEVVDEVTVPAIVSSESPLVHVEER